MAELSDKAREEFLSEAQEIIETFSRNLLSLDASLKAGISDPSLINEAFRAVHTLKGLAGLFGAVRLGALSHRLEDVLDDLRLGRVDLGQNVLDVLFGAIDAYTRILKAEKSESDEELDLDVLFAELERIGAGSTIKESPVADY